MKDIVKISWKEYGKLCANTLLIYNRYNFEADFIIAISRGGLPLGVYMSHALKIPLLTVSARITVTDFPMSAKLDTVNVVHNLTQAINNKNILVVDDIIKTGATVTAVINAISEFEVRGLKVVTFYQSVLTKDLPFDIIATQNLKEEWIVFPYETTN